MILENSDYDHMTHCLGQAAGGLALASGESDNNRGVKLWVGERAAAGVNKKSV
jgi:hypothetical protein